MSKNLKNEVRDFWNKNPMSYNIDVKDMDRKFYDRVDKIFFDHHKFGHDSLPIFSKLIDYETLRGKKVLEIGCGMGTMASQFAKEGAKITALDITHKAIEITNRRFNLFNLEGNLEVADAENLPFPDNTFDFVFSWGVLHHTPDTQKAIDEVYRVLKPGGKTAIMLYHKNSLIYYYHILFKKGILKMEILKHPKKKIVSRYTDFPDIGGSPLAKVYTRDDIRDVFGKFRNIEIRAFPMKGEMENIPSGRLPLSKWFFPKSFKKYLSEKHGWFLYVNVGK
ncbi:MAG: class I SAM-dependent methyltransferase [Candidatus Aenigmarchaeota archaeon]